MLVSKFPWNLSTTTCVVSRSRHKLCGLGPQVTLGHRRQYLAQDQARYQARYHPASMLKLSIGISIGTLMADGDKSFPLIAVNTHSILNNFGIVQMGPDFSPVLRQIIITHAYCRVSSVLTIV